MSDGSPICAIDFDGTIVDHRFPEVGAPVPGALDAIRTLLAMKWRVILWTMRSGKHLDDAVAFLKRHGIEPWAVNANPTQGGWTSSPKAYAHYYVDDAAIGTPLIRVPTFARPAVDWTEVMHMLFEREYGGDPRVTKETKDDEDPATDVRRAPRGRDRDAAVPGSPVRRGVGRPVLPPRQPRQSGR